MKGYIFDFGGTLDTAGTHWGKMLWHAYERQNIPIEEEDFRNAYVYAERELERKDIIRPESSFRETLEAKIELEFEYLSEQGLLEQTGFSLVSMQTAMLNDLYRKVKLITAESRTVLLSLKEKYPLVLVSNFYGNMNTVLVEFELDNVFDRVVESAVVGIRKPDLRIFQLGIDALALKSEDITVVGDSYSNDILPGYQLGCRTIWLKGETWKNEKDDPSAADLIISSLNDLTSE